MQSYDHIIKQCYNDIILCNNKNITHDNIIIILL